MMLHRRQVLFKHNHLQHCLNKATRKPSSPSPDSFTLFPHLPAELRLQVWEALASDSQAVELSCTPSSSYLPKAGRWFSHSPPPAIFSICAESRAVALRDYDLIEFEPEQAGEPWFKAYFNFAVDTLWLCSDLITAWAKDLLNNNHQLQKSLKFLAMDSALWNGLCEKPYTQDGSFKAVDHGLSMAAVKSIIGPFECLEGLRFHA